jgi:hypothetical protein
LLVSIFAGMSFSQGMAQTSAQVNVLELMLLILPPTPAEEKFFHFPPSKLSRLVVGPVKAG